MYADYIFNVPKDTEFDNLRPDIQTTIRWLASEWPRFPMVGTHEVDGRKLLHVRMDKKLTKAMLAAMIADKGLDWQILLIRSAFKEDKDEDGVPIYITEFMAEKSAFLPYMDPIFISETESRPATLADAIYLSCYAGTEPILLAAQ